MRVYIYQPRPRGLAARPSAIILPASALSIRIDPIPQHRSPHAIAYTKPAPAAPLPSHRVCDLARFQALLQM